MKRRTFLKGSAGLLLAGLAYNSLADTQRTPSIGCVRDPEASTDVATLQVTDPEAIRLLQFTDMHFGRYLMSEHLDQWTFRDMQSLVQRHKPDLLLITGDLWDHNRLYTGQAHLERGLTRLKQLKTPWLFTWGNHDQLNNYLLAHRMLSQAPLSLYRGGKYGGCYQVYLQSQHGKILWKLICLNSSATGLEMEAQSYLNQLRSENYPTFAIFHIPLQQYLTAWDKEHNRGFNLEAVSYGGYSLAIFQQLQDLKILACIAGHDHLNDYSVMAHNIELIYGRATGYAGYGQEHLVKGGKLYTLNGLTGEYTWQTVFADGSFWDPKA